MTEEQAFVKRFSELKFDGEIEWPVTVAKVEASIERGLTRVKPGSWVSVKPVAEARTFLGIHLGNLPVSEPAILTYHPPSKHLTTLMRTNPCIYVPGLNRVVWGYESWWTVIESPEQLRQISQADIDSVWYVQALKSLEVGATDPAVESVVESGHQ